ncbi:hypothetical protein ACRRTK_015521 [Alexandromys fortis]
MLLKIYEESKMNLEQERPFVCSAPGCSQRFPTEDHLMIHRHKHEMTLKFPSIKTDNMLSASTQVYEGDNLRGEPAGVYTVSIQVYEGDNLRGEPAGVSAASVQVYEGDNLRGEPAGVSAASIQVYEDDIHGKL